MVRLRDSSPTQLVIERVPVDFSFLLRRCCMISKHLVKGRFSTPDAAARTDTDEDLTLATASTITATTKKKRLLTVDNLTRWNSAKRTISNFDLRASKVITYQRSTKRICRLVV